MSNTTTKPKRKYPLKVRINIEDVRLETYAKELAHLSVRGTFNQYLPTPEEIEEMKFLIREENKLKYPHLLEEPVKVRSHNKSVTTYRLDPSGMGGRHGKVI